MKSNDKVESMKSNEKTK